MCRSLGPGYYVYCLDQFHASTGVSAVFRPRVISHGDSLPNGPSVSFGACVERE